MLDISEYIAGPYCGSLLADMGARVIKVEPPDGAEERRLGSRKRYRGNTRMALAYNRGKESLAVDLRKPEGRAIVIYALLREVDIVIQNYVPSVAKKLGIDYEALSAINPRLIFISSTAFGEVGPYQKRKGFDIIAHAASGIMSNYADEDGAPRAPARSTTSTSAPACSTRSASSARSTTANARARGRRSRPRCSHRTRASGAERDPHRRARPAPARAELELLARRGKAARAHRR